MQQVVEVSWERRGRQVQTSTEVAQEIAAATGLEELFNPRRDVGEGAFWLLPRANLPL
jgi:hypothetical protein